MSKYSSIWTNPLSLVLIFLALVWIFAIAKFCSNRMEVSTPVENTLPKSPVSNYELLPENNCPLKLSNESELLAAALLQQYFRLDQLNEQQEAIWSPNPKLDTAFVRHFEGNWETYVECMQTLAEDPNGNTEKIALIVSNFPDNNCRNCAPYVGFIRFRVKGDDPSTMVIGDSDRALFKFGAYGAIGDQISLVNLGQSQALLFSTAYTQQGLTLDSTVIYSIDDFRPLLRVKRFESNGGEDTPNQYQKRGTFYFQPEKDPYSPAKLALYQKTTMLNGASEKAPAPQIIYYQYNPDSLKYLEVRND